uniref:BHLH domain-containing protein n=1 Tax=Leersia perrieri TaxID=77586 RepID=A0A0D9UVW0_9ORYZ
MKSRKNTSTSSNSGGKCYSSSSGGGGQSKMERKDVEKNRRLHMKGLCLKLSSLIPPPAAATSPRRHHQHHQNLYSTSSPPSSTKETATQLDHLEQAAAYIKQLKGRIDDLKKRKQQATSLTSSSNGGKQAGGMPVVEVRCQEGTLDVVVVREAAAGDGERSVRLHEVIAVLEEEGAEVVNASFSVVGDKIFYTLHSQALCSRIGLDASRVSHRLRSLLLI